MELRELGITDETSLKRWLRPYLEEHLAWWTVAYGSAPRYQIDDLIDRDWAELISASRTSEHFVRVAEAAQPLGIVYAGLRTDRYMGITLGVLSWIYVAEEARGQGVSSHLMAAAEAWMKERGVAGREVFVTTQNHAALRLYERFGYRPVDSRMLGPG